MPPSDRRDAATEDLARAGARDAPIEIVAYDPSWPAAFEYERERLAPLLPGTEVHHFGSTAVPGLAAKPVIDMIALVGSGVRGAEAGARRPPPGGPRGIHRCQGRTHQALEQTGRNGLSATAQRF